MARLPVPAADVDVWGGILNDWERVEHNDDGSHVAPAAASGYNDDLAADIQGSDPVPMTIKSGVFVAKRPDVNVLVQLSALSWGNAGVLFEFLYGAVTPETPKSLRTTGTYSPPAAGVIRKNIGRAFFSDTECMTTHLFLTGLTPGTRYTWAIQASVISGSESILPPSGLTSPTGLAAQTDAITAQPKLYVAFFNDNRVVSYLMGGRPGFNLLDRKSQHQALNVITTGSGPYMIALTPDETKLVIGNVTDKTIQIVNTTTDAVTLTTAALTGAPNDVARDPGNTLAWIACADGHLRSVNLTTGVVVSDYTVSAQALNTLVTDATFAYCTCSVDSKVYKINLATGVTTSVTTAKPPQRIALDATNARVWAGTTTAGTSSLIEIRVSDLVVLRTISTAANSNVTAIAVSPNGRVLWHGRQDNTLAYHTINSPDEPDNNQFDAPNMGALAQKILLTADHYIYSALYTGQNRVNLWPSATWYCRALSSLTPSASAYGEFCNVNFAGATLG